MIPQKLRWKQENQLLQKRKQECEAAEVDLANRIYQVKDLLPSIVELKSMGVEFNLINAFITVVKEYASNKMIDERTATWRLSDILKSWSELEGYNNAISNAKKQLELLEMAIEDKKAAIAAVATLRKSRIYEREILEVMETIKKTNGGPDPLQQEEIPSDN